MIKSTIMMLLISMIFALGSKAQDSQCAVLLNGLDEKYTGGCKKGLAHGDGQAEGKLGVYVGKFRKGFPSGFGKLNYKRTAVAGSYYEGEWKRGLRQGEGTYYFSKDSITTGYWEDGVYIGKYQYPYKVTSSQAIPRYKFIKNNKSEPGVEIQFRRNGVRSMADIVSMSIQASSGSELRQANYIGYEVIQFPFECRIILTVKNKLNSNSYAANFDFKIYEEGSWIIVIDY